jgi:adenylate kinase family enzyme
MRLVVFGNSGSGKTTLARALAARHGLALLELDAIVWEPGQVAVQRPQAAIRAVLSTFLAEHDRWVVEGCYGELVEAAAPACTRLLFLDPGRDVCLSHNRARPWEPHKYPSAAAQDAMLDALQAWVAGYYERDDAWSHRGHLRIFESFEGPKTRISRPVAIDDLDIGRSPADAQ